MKACPPRHAHGESKGSSSSGFAGSKQNLHVGGSSSSSSSLTFGVDILTCVRSTRRDATSRALSVSMGVDGCRRLKANKVNAPSDRYYFVIEREKQHFVCVCRH
jgi:hypothetical protein